MLLIIADGADSKTDLKLDIVDDKSDDLGQFPSGKIMRFVYISRYSTCIRKKTLFL